MVRTADKVRGKPERFADHYTQATLFFNSQTPVEQQHIINAFRFELSKVQVPAIRERMVSGLRNVDERLAREVAEGLGLDPMPDAMPRVMPKKVKPEVTESSALSLMARPGDGSIRARRVAIIVADGVVGEEVEALAESLAAEGAVPVVLASRLGRVRSDRGKPIEISAPLDAAPAVVFDALILPDGGAAAKALASNGRALEFVKDTYRHCKPILVIGAASQVLDAAGVPKALPSGKADPGLLFAKSGAGMSTAGAFVKAIARHRHYERESDPPTV